MGIKLEELPKKIKRENPEQEKKTRQKQIKEIQEHAIIPTKGVIMRTM